MFTDSDTLVPMSSNMIGNIYFDEKNKMTSEWMLVLKHKAKFIASLHSNIHLFDKEHKTFVTSLRINQFDSTDISGNLVVKTNIVSGYEPNNDDRFHNGMFIEWKLVESYIYIYI